MSMQRISHLGGQVISNVPSAPPVTLMLTVADAARALSISEPVMWRLIARKEIPSVKVGRSRRILVSALEAYAEKLATEASDDGDAA